jgi:hypothetical protein
MDGTTYYVVERDRKVEESHLLAYAAEVIEAANPATPPPVTIEHLVAATVDGKPIRWVLPVVLTWALDESTFQGRPDQLAKARSICAQATADWNAAGRANGIYDKVRFEEDRSDPVFKFAFQQFGDPSLYAVAFFPNDLPSERVVNIGPATFEAESLFDPVGVIRHELGHVLGFRHEHIRVEAQEGMNWWERSRMEQWVTGGIGADALTDYDSQSVMHYPLNGRGTLDFQLSNADKAGFKTLYSLPSGSDEVREFPI